MSDHQHHSHSHAIDIHAHYFGQTYLDLLNEQAARYGTEYRKDGKGWYFKSPIAHQGPLPEKFIDIKQRVAEMDATGVGVHALSLTAPMVYWAEPDFSLKLSRAWNDDAVAAAKAYPDRFVVLATLPMLDAERSIDELDRVAKIPSVRGVYMGTNINGRDLDDPLFDPIFACIDKHGLPVFLHPQQVIGGERLRKFYLVNFLGNPFDSAVAACRLIFGGVLDKYPNLQFNLPHAGGALPGLIGRIDHGWKVRTETKHLANAPSTYLRRFTYDTISHSAPILKFVISMVGADRVMIGSDYCFDMGYERPLSILDEAGLSDADRKLIMGGNAARLLKM